MSHTVEVHTEGASHMVRLVPDQPLEPLHTYAIEEPGITGPPHVTFTTGTGPDRAGPPRVELRDVQGGYFGDGGTCGRSMYLIPKVSAAPDDAFYEVQLGWDQDFDDAVSLRGPTPPLMGWAMCMETVPDLQRSDEVWLRARAVDLSGHVGAWSEVAYLPRIPNANPTFGGCATHPTAPAPWSLGLATLALARRRRRPWRPD